MLNKELVFTDNDIYNVHFVDPCLPNPCKNGGSCFHGNDTGVALCSCTERWSGHFCTEENSGRKIF